MRWPLINCALQRRAVIIEVSALPPVPLLRGAGRLQRDLARDAGALAFSHGSVRTQAIDKQGAAGRITSCVDPRQRESSDTRISLQFIFSYPVQNQSFGVFVQAHGQ